VAGVPAADLPAYAYQEPVATWLEGYGSQTAHWPIAPPPAEDIDPEPEHYDFELRIPDAG
jgi:hypothetical protein